jgi:hypothetical protein
MGYFPQQPAEPPAGHPNRSWVYNYGFRYYHPELGRWISRDPISDEVFANNLPENIKDSVANSNGIHSGNLDNHKIAYSLIQAAPRIQFLEPIDKYGFVANNPLINLDSFGLKLLGPIPLGTRIHICNFSEWKICAARCKAKGGLCVGCDVRVSTVLYFDTSTWKTWTVSTATQDNFCVYCSWYPKWPF